MPLRRSGDHSFLVFLVPKLYLGTRVSPQLRCFSPGGEAQLRRQVRSQVQLGNEGGINSVERFTTQMSRSLLRGSLLSFFFHPDKAPGFESPCARVIYADARG